MGIYVNQSDGSMIEVASDEVAGKQYQIIKIVTGGDGIANDVSYALMPAGFQPNGTEPGQKLTVSNVEGGVQFDPFHADTTHIAWTIENGDVRCTLDGGAPDATTGLLLSDGGSSIWTKEMAEAAKFFRAGSVDAIIQAYQLRPR
jgi:hypothetical protein